MKHIASGISWFYVFNYVIYDYSCNEPIWNLDDDIDPVVGVLHFLQKPEDIKRQYRFYAE